MFDGLTLIAPVASNAPPRCDRPPSNTFLAPIVPNNPLRAEHGVRAIHGEGSLMLARKGCQTPLCGKSVGLSPRAHNCIHSGLSLLETSNPNSWKEFLDRWSAQTLLTPRMCSMNTCKFACTDPAATFNTIGAKRSIVGKHVVPRLRLVSNQIAI